MNLLLKSKKTAISVSQTHIGKYKRTFLCGLGLLRGSIWNPLRVTGRETAAKRGTLWKKARASGCPPQGGFLDVGIKPSRYGSGKTGQMPGGGPEG